MFILLVTLEVTSEGREEFLEAIAVNAGASVRDEEGCYRFDVIELASGSNSFAFYEVYRDEAAFELEHKNTPHYFAYRDVSARVVVPGSQENVSGKLFKTYP